jgi:hypothetical protein
LQKKKIQANLDEQKQEIFNKTNSLALMLTRTRSKAKDENEP